MEIKLRIIERLHFRCHFSAKEPFLKRYNILVRMLSRGMSHCNAPRRAQQSSLLPAGIGRGCQDRVQETAGLHRHRFLPALQARSGPACLQARRPLWGGIRSGSADPGLPGLRRSWGQFSPALVLSVSRVSLFIKTPVVLD